MIRKPQGIISYAGLDVPTLLAGARLMFTNTDEQMPPRFASLMPLFPLELIQSMPFVGVAQPGQNVAPGGFSIDPAEYHCLLHEQMPRLYTGDNLIRNTDAEGVFHGRGIVTVDEVWTTCFPQFQPFAGERLTIYPLGGGAQAVAVPESLYPKAAGLLRQAETALGVTRRCHDYAHYVYQRIRSGQTFDADQYETEYLAQMELSPVTIAQSDLGRLMQDVSMLKNARDGAEGDGLFTENAKRAEHILQYVPGLYACDTFEDTPITRHTARLLQPVWEDGYVSDWWLPYADAAAYAADHQTLDMTALCQGFQLAPVYDPLTRGGRYPDQVRVVILRDKELRLRTAETINNPAYGSGMSPLGAMNRLVYLPDSREWLRQGRLTLEEHHLRCENTAVPPQQYRTMVSMAALQEQKGQLVDALYRRESVLNEVLDTTPDHDRLHQLMQQPVTALESRLSGREKAQLSGYDADMDYLRRMGMEREWKPGPKKTKTFRFAPDSLRQASIESGFAMRGALLRYDWAALMLPPASPDPIPPDDDRPDDPDAQPLPPQRPPLWLNAADACNLTTDVGGLYPTEEEMALTGAQPPQPDALASAPAEEPPAKTAAPKKKAAKSGGKAKGSKAKKTAGKPATSGRPFSEEELMERQVHLVLPEEETAPAPEADCIPEQPAVQPAHGEGTPAAQSAQAVQPAPEADCIPEQPAVQPASKEQRNSDEQPISNEDTADAGAANDAAANEAAANNVTASDAAARSVSVAQADPSKQPVSSETAAASAQPAPNDDTPAAQPTPETTPAPESPAAPAQPKGEASAIAFEQLKNGQLRFLPDDLL